MSRGTAIFLIVLGAILGFAVTAETRGIDIQTAGFILLIVGVGGLLWSFYRTRVADAEREAELLAMPDPQLPRVEEVDPMVLAELVGRVHALVGQSRTFLEAEGYTNERIDELASEFVAGDHGRSRDEFIAWAVSQDHLPRPSLAPDAPDRTATAPTEELA
jgi:Domain of unknown function (DUF6458)